MRMDSISGTFAADRRKSFAAQAEAKRLRKAGRRDGGQPRHAGHRFGRVKFAEPAPLSFCIGG